jgi:ferredoxin
MGEVEDKKCQEYRCCVKPVFETFVGGDRVTASFSDESILDEAEDDTSLAGKIR